VKAAAVILAALLVIAHPAALAAGLGVVLAVLDAAAFVLAHLLLVLAAELAALAVIVAGVARSAGVRRYWRARRWVPWTP